MLLNWLHLQSLVRTLSKAQMPLSVLGCGSQGLPPHRRKNMKRASHRITEVPSSALPSRLGSWVGTVFGHATSVKKKKKSLGLALQAVEPEQSST